MSFDFIDRKFKRPEIAIMHCDTCEDYGWIDQTMGAGIGVICERWVECPDCDNTKKEPHP
jgi:hypothetical protein